MVVIGLGSNIGDRLKYLSDAIILLSEFITDIKISSIYESQALLKSNAPDEWNVPFLNMAIKGETNLSPQALLESVKQIEKKIGRLDRGLWAPREIDIDILAYKEEHIIESNLIIPHAALCLRDFVLLPFVDLAPEWRYPVQGEYYGMTIELISKMVCLNNNSIKKTLYTLNIK